MRGSLSRSFAIGVVALVIVVAGAAFVGARLANHGNWPYEPEVAGAVASTTFTPDGLTVYHLANGKQFTADAGNGKTFVVTSGSPVGDLLLGGHAGDRVWVALLSPASRFGSGYPDGCYALDSAGTDEGSSVQTDVGLRLRKTSDFYVGNLHLGASGRYDGDAPRFCLNTEGLVTSFP